MTAQAADIQGDAIFNQERVTYTPLLGVPIYRSSPEALALFTRSTELVGELVDRYGLARIRTGAAPYPSEFLSEEACRVVRQGSPRHNGWAVEGYQPDAARELCVYTQRDGFPLVVRWAGTTIEAYGVSPRSKSEAHADLALRLHGDEPALVLVEVLSHAGCSISGGWARFDQADCDRLAELAGDLNTLISEEEVR